MTDKHDEAIAEAIADAIPDGAVTFRPKRGWACEGGCGGLFRGQISAREHYVRRHAAPKLRAQLAARGLAIVATGELQGLAKELASKVRNANREKSPASYFAVASFVIENEPSILGHLEIASMADHYRLDRDRLANEREALRAALSGLVKYHADEIAHLRDLKSRGDLTRDYGEALLTHEILAEREITRLEARAALALADAPRLDPPGLVSA